MTRLHLSLGQKLAVLQQQEPQLTAAKDNLRAQS